MLVSSHKSHKSRVRRACVLYYPGAGEVILCVVRVVEAQRVVEAMCVGVCVRRSLKCTILSDNCVLSKSQKAPPTIPPRFPLATHTTTRSTYSRICGAGAVWRKHCASVVLGQCECVMGMCNCRRVFESPLHVGVFFCCCYCCNTRRRSYASLLCRCCSDVLLYNYTEHSTSKRNNGKTPPPPCHNRTATFTPYIP